MKLRSPSLLFLPATMSLSAIAGAAEIPVEPSSPRVDGELVQPPISGVVWGGIPSQEHLQIIDEIKEYEVPLDVYWFDAGWYGTGTMRKAWSTPT